MYMHKYICVYMCMYVYRCVTITIKEKERMVRHGRGLREKRGGKGCSYILIKICLNISHYSIYNIQIINIDSYLIFILKSMYICYLNIFESFISENISDSNSSVGP